MGPSTRERPPSFESAMTDQHDPAHAALSAARSFLFVPGDRPERFDKAVAAGADQVIIDLEDAVASTRKAAARSAIAAWLSPERPVLLRINAVSSPEFQRDLEFCGRPGIDGIVIPKAETADQLDRVHGAVPDIALLPLVETALGIGNARDLASCRAVVRLMFGTIDFQLDLGIPEDGEALATFRSLLVLASRLGGAAAPVDGVTAALDDAAGLAADVARARRFGFGGKLCVHPRQVPTVNAGFAPTRQEENWARRILDAARGSAPTELSAIAVDGEMIDRPAFLKAKRIIQQLRVAGR